MKTNLAATFEDSESSNMIRLRSQAFPRHIAVGRYRSLTADNPPKIRRRQQAKQKHLDSGVA
jgi:hypothetical protein